MLGTQVDDVGYISPGHGLKGRQNTSLIDEDLDQMYLREKIFSYGLCYY